MPLSDEALTIHGGCNCRAVRYRIEVPPVSQRPIHPWSDGAVKLPMIVLCHCNDCRRASAGLTLAGFCAPVQFVQVSLLPRPSTLPPPVATRVEPKDDDLERVWLPASEIFAPSTPPADSSLATYQPSAGVARTFCSRCGTNLTYTRHPMPAGWPAVVDILLGTVDRGDLENDALAPERHVWWDKGISWIRRLYNDDGGLPRHPLSNLTDVVE